MKRWGILFVLQFNREGLAFKWTSNIQYENSADREYSFQDRQL